MERKMPTYKIEGAEFIVDTGKYELREVGNPANTISFHDMIDTGSYYSFQFDKKENKMLTPFKPITQDTVTVRVPQLVELDPIGMAEKYGLSVADLNGKSDFDIMINSKLLNERKNGILPTIRIAGHEFIID